MVGCSSTACRCVCAFVVRMDCGVAAGASGVDAGVARLRVQFAHAGTELERGAARRCALRQPRHCTKRSGGQRREEAASSDTIQRSDGFAGELLVGALRSDSSADFPLYLTAVPDVRMRLVLNYDSSRYDAHAIARMLGHLACWWKGWSQIHTLRSIACPCSPRPNSANSPSSTRHRSATTTSRAASINSSRNRSRTPDAIALVFERPTHLHNSTPEPTDSPTSCRPRRRTR